MVLTGSVPSWDPAARRLRLSPRQLGALARVAVGAADPGDDPLLGALADAGLLDDLGRVVAELRPVATAAATTALEVAVTRVGRGGATTVGVAWSGTGIVVCEQAGPDDVRDVAFQAPTRVARTLWRVLRLGPRPARKRPQLTGLDVEELLGPFEGRTGDRAGGRAGGVGGGREDEWVAELGVDSAAMTLDRLDIIPPDGSTAAYAVLDGRRAGLWEVTSTSDARTVDLIPTDPAAVFAVLATWQASTREAAA